MARVRKSVALIDQIKELRSMGHGVRAIARSLKIGRPTVRKFLKNDDPSYKTTVVEDPKDLNWRDALDWEAIVTDKRNGITFRHLYREHAPEVSYHVFWRELRSRCPTIPTITMKLNHVPGEKTQVDYTDGLDFIDRKTGEVTKTQLFVGVLPFSSKTFAHFSLNQKLPSFIESHEKMWIYFGGVTPYVVVDNLKSAVNKAHIYDPDANPTYCSYANHAGFAVMPARPYRPRDKGAVESACGIIQRQFFQRVRNQNFYSLAELNSTLFEYLGELNQAVMKDFGVSRDDRFTVERDKLLILPVSNFEISESRSSTVHPDCHIQIYRNFYSVPYQHVGQKVRVKITSRMIEVFSDGGQPLAAHSRQSGRYQYSTIEAHYPEEKTAVARFEVHSARKQGQQVGPHTEKLVEKLLNISHPLRYLRRIQGILRLFSAEHTSREALEYGCDMAMKFDKPRLKYIKDCAAYFERNGKSPALLAPERDQSTLFLHQPTKENKK